MLRVTLYMVSHRRISPGVDQPTSQDIQHQGNRAQTFDWRQALQAFYAMETPQLVRACPVLWGISIGLMAAYWDALFPSWDWDKMQGFILHLRTEWAADRLTSHNSSDFSLLHRWFCGKGKSGETRGSAFVPRPAIQPVPGYSCLLLVGEILVGMSIQGQFFQNKTIFPPLVPTFDETVILNIAKLKKTHNPIPL